MSHVEAKVIEILKHDNVHIVKFQIADIDLSMMSLELDSKILIGSKVKLNIKPSHVAIAKKIQGEVSYSNQIDCTIVSCQNGELLCVLELEFANTKIESIITQESALRMNLCASDRVKALIKASEISISEIINA